MPGYYGAYSSPRYYPSQTPQPQSQSRRESDYVSDFDHVRQGKSRRRYSNANPYGSSSKHHYHTGDRDRQHRSSQSRYYTKVVIDDDYPYHDEPPPPYYEERYQQSYGNYGGTDYYGYYHQVPVYTEAEPTATRSRARRASHSAQTKPPPPRPRPSTAKASRKATEEDARKAGIPAGYSIKNWDPDEEPIMLLGSVFDANSLGKWIYDWTVFHHGPATPMSDLAGDLWLLLIQFAGKVKRAEECMPKVRKTENREMVEDFLESGERLWMRFANLLGKCEEFMWKAAKKEAGGKKPVTMGKNAGCEFVDTIFGRDRQLETTEKLMTGMRLWSMRFDANCDEILQHPTA
jgi:hypothetical protein